jgi:hypothetical protein
VPEMQRKELDEMIDAIDRIVENPVFRHPIKKFKAYKKMLTIYNIIRRKLEKSSLRAQ